MSPPNRRIPPATMPIAAPGTSGNNGNTMGYYFQDNAATPTPDMDQMATFTYDALNRLTRSLATGNQSHDLNFSLDRYGNTKCVQPSTGPCTSALSFDAGTNRITTSGFTYDGRGT